MVQTLWAVADLHAAVRANGGRIDTIQPHDPSDWLIVAGDVAERTSVVIDVLHELRQRFATVIWVPGNHELFVVAVIAFRAGRSMTNWCGGVAKLMC